MFTGYDTDTDMLRIGCMNMTLHGVENPTIKYNNSLLRKRNRTIEFIPRFDVDIVWVVCCSVLKIAFQNATNRKNRIRKQ